MKLISSRMAGLIVGVATIAACENVPMDVDVEPRFSASDRVLVESLYDLTGSYFVFACTEQGDPLPVDQGELVQLEGKVFERLFLIDKGDAGFLYTLHTMPVGLRGVGVDSSEEFRVTERGHFMGNSHLAGGNGTYRQELKLVGTATHRTFWVVYNGYYHVSKDGTAELTRDNQRIVCKPGQ